MKMCDKWQQIYSLEMTSLGCSGLCPKFFGLPKQSRNSLDPGTKDIRNCPMSSTHVTLCITLLSILFHWQVEDDQPIALKHTSLFK